MNVDKEYLFDAIFNSELNIDTIKDIMSEMNDVTKRLTILLLLKKVDEDKLTEICLSYSIKSEDINDESLLDYAFGYFNTYSISRLAADLISVDLIELFCNNRLDEHNAIEVINRELKCRNIEDKVDIHIIEEFVNVFLLRNEAYEVLSFIKNFKLSDNI